MLRVKPPSFTRLEQLSLICKNYRARQTCFPASSRNSQNQPCRKLNCRKTFHARTCAALAKSLASSMGRRKRSLTFAADLSCVPLPKRRCPLAARRTSITSVFAFCLPTSNSSLGSRVGGVLDWVVIECELACSIKGNVKGNTPPSTGRGADFLDFQPLRALRHVVQWYRPHLFAFHHGLSAMRRRQSVCET